MSSDMYTLTDEEVAAVIEGLERKSRLVTGYYNEGYECAVQNSEDPTLKMDARLAHAKDILATPGMRYPWEVGWAVGVLYHLYLDNCLNKE